MDITLNSSCSADNDYIRVSPISGKAYVEKSSIKPGVWTKTIAIAKDPKDCKVGNGNAPKPGQTCTQYSAGASGNGIIIQRTTAYDGGQNAVPYEQLIITITGAM